MSFNQIFVEPWVSHFSAYWPILVMAFFVTAVCGLIGNYLVLRKISLVGDAISHSVLPGIAIAYMIAGSRSDLAMFIGALIAGIFTTLIIELIHSRSKIKKDAAIGITFTTMFAVGVILVSLYGADTDLDLDCVLFGKLDFMASKEKVFFGLPQIVLTMGFILILIILLIVLFYKELLISSFDPSFAATLGIKPRLVHYCLMCSLSVVVVSSFSSVGAILVIAMLILPAATVYLLTDRLWLMMILSILHAFLSSIIGLHLTVALKVSTAPACVVAGMFLFRLSWVISPRYGLLRHLSSSFDLSTFQKEN